MATHSRILAWRIPWTEEPGGRQSVGFQSQTRLSDQDFHFSVATICYISNYLKIKTYPVDRKVAFYSEKQALLKKNTYYRNIQR